MSRDDFPIIGHMIQSAVAGGDVGYALKLADSLFPTWGCQVGHPLRTHQAYGWYASVFRMRSANETTFAAGHYSHHGERDGVVSDKYASSPALAIVAAICHALAAGETPVDRVADSDEA